LSLILIFGFSNILYVFWFGKKALLLCYFNSSGLGVLTPFISNQNMNEISATEKTAISMVLKVLLAPNIIFICTIMIPVKI